ncbi:uncharacterized protein [Ptychodera flava]|uniref:uncharacterized protein n=1 Tax=Ptychodera flava TaxID=63121 RepID=UPI00396A49F9
MPAITENSNNNEQYSGECGYGVALYIGLIHKDERRHCAFLMGKARVEPPKKITILRLELTAATVAVRMNRMLAEELNIKNDKVSFWTDRTSVIKYCANETSQFYIFVANQINITHGGSDSKQWKYVDTKYNQADDASRGLTAVIFCKTKDGCKNQISCGNEKEDGLHSRTSPERYIIKTQKSSGKHLCTAHTSRAGVWGRKDLLCYSSMMKLKKIEGWFLLAKKILQDR